MPSYYFPNSDDDEPIQLKYKIGDDIAGIAALQDYTFTFTFDYLSLESSDLCFNNSNVSKEDFVEIFSLKKKLSRMRVKDIQDKFRKEFHFHEISLVDKGFLVQPLKNLFNYTKFIQPYDLPTLYQIAVYTNNELLKAPRIVGFFGKYGVFHVLWLDYHHKINPIKK
jgi:hypothetical protein